MLQDQNNTRQDILSDNKKQNIFVIIIKPAHREGTVYHNPLLSGMFTSQRLLIGSESTEICVYISVPLGLQIRVHHGTLKGNKLNK